MVRRRGHSRTSAKGTVFRVREHKFRPGASSAEYKLRWINGNAHINGSVTYLTTCPQCKGPVFFYRNEAGSRVFFDQLGKPWPKRGCVHGIRKMEFMPITLATPVKCAHLKEMNDGAPPSEVSLNLERLKSAVASYNQEQRRAAKRALKARSRKPSK